VGYLHAIIENDIQYFDLYAIVAMSYCVCKSSRQASSGKLFVLETTICTILVWQGEGVASPMRC